MGLMEIPSELSVSPLKGSGASWLIRPRNGALSFPGKKVPQGGISTEGLLRPIRLITAGKRKVALKL